MYKYIYVIPNEFSNIIMKSDGEFLTSLCFVSTKDDLKHNTECEEKEYREDIATGSWGCCWLKSYMYYYSMS